jgi:hypothetical protein
MKIRITQQTIAKLPEYVDRQPIIPQAANIPLQYQHVVQPGEYALHWLRPSQDRHLLVSFVVPLRGFHVWHVFDGHVRLTDPNSSSVSEAITAGDTLPGAPNFTWREVTANGTRPVPENLRGNVIRVAGIMQEIRNFVREPVVVISWYRPPHVNQLVGGASDSRHLYGDGVDFYVPSIAGWRMYEIADRIVGNRGGVGLYKHGGSHVDARGSRARWSH